VIHGARSEESRTVRLGDAEVSFRLRRSVRRRSVSLHIDEQGLTVSVPWRCSEQRLQTILREAENWVLRRLASWAHQRPTPITWCTGDVLHYLGATLTLEVATATGRARAARLHDRLLLAVPNPADPVSVQKLGVRWLRTEALAVFAANVLRLAPLMGVAAPRIFLSSARTRWGSCNADGSIRLNWRLVQAREALIEYVIVHELAHFHEMNHGPRFWGHVGRVCPDHRALRAELNEVGRRLLLMPTL
jgi:predicted metal-dependent hydrolase